MEALDVDGTKYYMLGHQHTLVAPLGVSATGSSQLTVTVTLDGLVFGLANPEMQICDNLPTVGPHGTACVNSRSVVRYLKGAAR